MVLSSKGVEGAGALEEDGIARDLKSKRQAGRNQFDEARKTKEATEVGATKEYSCGRRLDDQRRPTANRGEKKKRKSAHELSPLVEVSCNSYQPLKILAEMSSSQTAMPSTADAVIHGITLTGGLLTLPAAGA